VQIVKRIILNGGILLSIFFILVISALTFASDKGIVTTQGVVMALDLEKKTIIINERAFTLDENTIIHNEKGSPVTLDNLRARTWVYIEGVENKAQKRVVVKKIYLLPKYIDGKEKNLYPFIK
jgi:hypothetical protein